MSGNGSGTVAEAQRMVALRPDDFELALAQLQPTTLVGQPFYGVLLYREQS